MRYVKSIQRLLTIALFVVITSGTLTNVSWAQNSPATSLDYSQLQPATVEDLAKAGDPAAQWHHAMNILQNKPDATDEIKAFEWVSQSADSGYLNGILSKAVMHAMGEGTEQDYELAFRAYERAARRGSGHAMRGIGGMYCDNTAPKKDYNGTQTRLDYCAAALIIGLILGDGNSEILIKHYFNADTEDAIVNLIEKTHIARLELEALYGIELPSPK